MGTTSPLRKRLQTNIDEKLLNRLRHVALDKNLKLNEILELIISSYLDSIDKKNGNGG